MATAQNEIELPFGPHVAPNEWGDEAYVYGVDEWFAVTAHEHQALALASKNKFKAKVSFKENPQTKKVEVFITLPYEFARAYLWQKKMALTPIEYGNNIAIVIWNPEVGQPPTVGNPNDTPKVS
jgi:hypothetical protein